MKVNQHLTKTILLDIILDKKIISIKNIYDNGNPQKLWKTFKMKIVGIFLYDSLQFCQNAHVMNILKVNSYLIF